MSTETSFKYRDGLVMIGRKGAAPGTAKELYVEYHVSGRSHLTSCLSNKIYLFKKYIRYNIYNIYARMFHQMY